MKWKFTPTPPPPHSPPFTQGWFFCRTFEETPLISMLITPFRKGCDSNVLDHGRGTFPWKMPIILIGIAAALVNVRHQKQILLVFRNSNEKQWMTPRWVHSLSLPLICSPFLHFFSGFWLHFFINKSCRWYALFFHKFSKEFLRPSFCSASMLFLRLHNGFTKDSLFLTISCRWHTGSFCEKKAISLFSHK